VHFSYAAAAAAATTATATGIPTTTSAAEELSAELLAAAAAYIQKQQQHWFAAAEVRHSSSAALTCSIHLRQHSLAAFIFGSTHSGAVRMSRLRQKLNQISVKLQRGGGFEEALHHYQH
jgi:hypothetical protein